MVELSPEKEHYALIMYDNNGADNGQLIDEKIYVGGTKLIHLLIYLKLRVEESH